MFYDNPPQPSSRSEFLLATRSRLIEQGECTEENADAYLETYVRERQWDVAPAWVDPWLAQLLVEDRAVLFLDDPPTILFDPSSELVAYQAMLRDWIAANISLPPKWSVSHAPAVGWSSAQPNVTVSYTPHKKEY